jgi:imidazoleglycerol-phosphate dehydratase/histidinol-phosphatase
MKKILFIDRDGTIIQEPEDEQVDSFEKFFFLPGVIRHLAQISFETDFILVMITNQDGLGTDSFPEENFWPVQNKIIDVLKGEGIIFDDILIDRTFPGDKAPTRKPGTALLKHYMHGNYDLKNSFVIGDRPSDIGLAENLGCRSIFLSKEKNDRATCNAPHWQEIYAFLKSRNRIAEVHRKTAETDIYVRVNLDGNGKSDIKTGIGFFDHMLDQLCRHGNLDMTISVHGDLHVDEHHTIEDTAIVLGQAFARALGSKKGIERYGFFVPMDDSLAQVILDFGGRPYLSWKADFKREKIGEMPTELFRHFFRSFADQAGCTLHIQAHGDNEHHKIEAIFKAFAKAICMAKKIISNGTIPSTKGSI